MRRSVLIISFLVSVLAATLAGFAAWVYLEYTRPGDLPENTAIVIEKGFGVYAIGKELARAGVIRQPLIFGWAARIKGIDKVLKAGEYDFPAAVSLSQTLAILKAGKTVLRQLTVPEGLTSAEIMRLLLSTEGLTGPIPAAFDEGRLLPETYYYSFADSRADLVRRMVAAMDQLLAKLWQSRAPDLPLSSPYQALILASIVEKETGRDSERAKIAGVFINRLRRGMRLQSDPTVTYGITRGLEPLSRGLSLADLKTPTPYNTYTIKGLPPTPISNPGVEALKAALNPEKSDNLYFVANGLGGHAFAKTLKQHNRNVARWRTFQKSTTQ